MTGSDDSYSGSRPISVAELLAKNGTIGAPPAGGRRRRRRGNADAVSVAELTGEIPIIVDEPAPSPAAAEVAEQPEDADTDAVPSAEGVIDDDIEPENAEPESAEPESAEPENTEPENTEPENTEPENTDETDTDEVAQVRAGPDVDVDVDVDVDDDYADAVAEYAEHLEHRSDDAAPVTAPPPRRFGFGRRSSKKSKDDVPPDSLAADAEHMSPDPPDGEETDVLAAAADPATDIEELEDLDGDEEEVDSDDSGVAPEVEDTDELPSYLRSTQGPLFGGQSVADDLARRGARSAPGKVIRDEVADLVEDDTGDGDDDGEDAEYAEPRPMSGFVYGLWIVGQSILAVLLGAGLFFAFDQLWKWNNIIALVLSVLVILGLVVAVRVVRKTEDIGSTLIAVAVGALVTLGPLALLQSG